MTIDRDTITDALISLISRDSYVAYHSYAIGEELLRGGYSQEQIARVLKAAVLARDSPNVARIAETFAGILEDKDDFNACYDAEQLHLQCVFRSF